jgi:hypothetical protein
MRGVLDQKTYRPVIEKAWAVGMLKHVYVDGRLGCIQAYLLAGSEIRRMVRIARKFGL